MTFKSRLRSAEDFAGFQGIVGGHSPRRVVVVGALRTGTGAVVVVGGVGGVGVGGVGVGGRSPGPQSVALRVRRGGRPEGT